MRPLRSLCFLIVNIINYPVEAEIISYISHQGLQFRFPCHSIVVYGFLARRALLQASLQNDISRTSRRCIS